MKILLVEDDTKISSIIKMGLEDNDCMVDVAYDSAQGERLIMSKKYDVILLDVMLPGISGFELCRNIRNNKIKTPIMMLTTLDSVDDKVEGFESGADDYLVKPFSFKELNARIKALDRRNKETVIQPVLKVADLELNNITKKVKRGDTEIKLTATEFKLLELLLKNKDKVMERLDIAEKVWGFNFYSGTNVIDVHINSLRNKIDKDFTPKLINTIVGMGYVLREE
jgi:two-component system, OmpR family, copper resistance phosphate regulon response regulator CusR